MPSFDIVSKVDMHELTNAIDQANREVSTRFDFKDTGAKFVFSENKKVALSAPSKFQIEQMRAILEAKFAKRGIEMSVLKFGEISEALHEAKLEATIEQGIAQEFAKKIVKTIKDLNLKVQTSIQGDQVRVTGKKRDDLQEAIQALRSAKLEQPLQYENFRD